MNIYTQKQQWKIWLFIAALCIVGISMWYTNSLVQKISEDERKKVSLWADAIQRKASLVKFTNNIFQKIQEEERKRIEIWAGATKMLVLTESEKDQGFYLEIIRGNMTIPVILTDNQGKISSWKNIEEVEENRWEILSEEQKSFLLKEQEVMKAQHTPIEIDFYKGAKNYLYYKNSKIFSELKTVFDGLIKSFISEVAVNSASAPVLFTDSTKQNIISFGNVDSVKIQDKQFVSSLIQSMSAQNQPIEIELGNGGKNYIFYQDSFLLTQLKYYPFVQFGVIGLFLIIAYTLFSTARKSEQNQVWVGMAKETAHQLGTPLSSLIAWVEYLKLKGVDETTLKEVRQDIGRLETITERFSKIGSTPVLEKKVVFDVMKNALDYIAARTSKRVLIKIDQASSPIVMAQMNVPLFEWVVENVCKNAIDAMDGVGNIDVMITDQMQFVYIDITDTGKGMEKSKFKTVFEPGFTTKQRGWGLGLSLAKRIIENYHSGKIFVKSSELGKGTTFRIVLNK